MNSEMLRFYDNRGDFENEDDAWDYLEDEPDDWD